MALSTCCVLEQVADECIKLIDASAGLAAETYTVPLRSYERPTTRCTEAAVASFS